MDWLKSAAFAGRSQIPSPIIIAHFMIDTIVYLSAILKLPIQFVSFISEDESYNYFLFAIHPLPWDIDMPIYRLWCHCSILEDKPDKEAYPTLHVAWMDIECLDSEHHGHIHCFQTGECIFSFVSFNQNSNVGTAQRDTQSSQPFSICGHLEHFGWVLSVPRLKFRGKDTCFLYQLLMFNYINLRKWETSASINCLHND